MTRVPYRLFLGLLSILITTGCESVPVRINLTSVKSQGVEQIPSKLGIYPFLSTSLAGEPGSAYGLCGMEGGKTASSLSVSKMGDNVAITPASNTTLLVTQESQILSDSLSTDLSSCGFSLKQLPVEMQDEKNTASDKRKGFFISINLLNDLRTNYGIEAIALCDAFFIIKNNYYERVPPEKRVVSAHVKIIDTKTLDVLGQVNLPYIAEGANMNDTASEIAASLAKLANMDLKNKK